MDCVFLWRVWEGVCKARGSCAGAHRGVLCFGHFLGREGLLDESLWSRDPHLLEKRGNEYEIHVHFDTLEQKPKSKMKNLEPRTRTLLNTQNTDRAARSAAPADREPLWTAVVDGPDCSFARMDRATGAQGWG